MRIIILIVCAVAMVAAIVAIFESNRNGDDIGATGANKIVAAGVQPRSLSAAQLVELTEAAKPFLASTHIGISARRDDDEALSFADQLNNCLGGTTHVEHWTDAGDQNGVVLQVKDEKNPPALATQLFNHLTKFGILVKMAACPGWPDSDRNAVNVAVFVNVQSPK